MKDIETLTILQYNVRNDRLTTMIPLLADPRVQEYDVIAIQEPWRNPNMPTTLSSHQSGFHLLYRPGGDTRVCFYINDKINPSSWEVSYPSRDMCSLALSVHTEGKTKLIHIHNVYNPSPISYSSTNSPSTIPEAQHSLESDGEHILLGDFNLHHPYWSGPSRPTQHAAADQLLNLVAEKELSLALPKGTVTWEARGSYSTIDLVFMTEFLAERLEHCKAREDIGQLSDHIPISTRLRLGSDILLPVKRRAFKLLDMDKLREAERRAPRAPVLRTHNDIEEFTKTVQAFLKSVIEASVPWARPALEAKPFWN